MIVFLQITQLLSNYFPKDCSEKGKVRYVS